MGDKEVNINVIGREYPLEQVMGSGENMWNMEEVLEETSCGIVGIASSKILNWKSFGAKGMGKMAAAQSDNNAMISSKLACG